MKITRLDLDGVGSPIGLATRIHEVEPLPYKVPLEELCRALGITTIRETDTGSFEAALVTDALKSSGDIVLSSQSPWHRKRFSLAHELGHFLIEAHRPREGRPIECSLDDLHLLNPKDRDQRRRIEAEANRFAAHLLMPHKRIREFVGKSGASLETLVTMAGEFAVSKEAMARTFVDASRDPVAIIISRNGRVMRRYRSEDFPFLPDHNGKHLPPDSLSADGIAAGTYSPAEEIEPEVWLSERDAERVLTLTEQVLGQQGGYSLTLLSAELDHDL